MTDPVEGAVERLFEQFSILANVGYSGGPMAGEQSTYRLTIPLTGRIMEGITVISNLPHLPYAASPTRVAQDAVFKWLYVLTGVLQMQDQRLALLHKAYAWEQRLAQAAEESRQLQLFRTYLAQKILELDEGALPLEVLSDLRSAARDAPTVMLQTKCSRAVAENGPIRAALNALPHDLAEPYIGWLEPYVT